MRYLTKTFDLFRRPSTRSSNGTSVIVSNMRIDSNAEIRQ